MMIGKKKKMDPGLSPWIRGWCGHCANLTVDQTKDLTGLVNSCSQLPRMAKGRFLENCKNYEEREIEEKIS